MNNSLGFAWVVEMAKIDENINPNVIHTSISIFPSLSLYQLFISLLLGKIYILWSFFFFFLMVSFTSKIHVSITKIPLHVDQHLLIFLAYKTRYPKDLSY